MEVELIYSTVLFKSNVLYRPMSAYGAFDQPTYKVDLTPWIPLLGDGKGHTISLNVVSIEGDHAILSNWWLSGNIQVFHFPSLDKTTSI